MTEWPFRIATRSDVPRKLVENMRVQYTSVDIQNLATVSIFCEEESHSGDPWLIGTFSPLEEMLGKGRLYWAFRSDYPTGDGYMIPVGEGESKVSLLHERVVDWESLSLPERTHLMYDEPEPRARYKLACGLCSLAATRKEHGLNEAITQLYSEGFREVPLSFLIGAMKRFDTPKM